MNAQKENLAMIQGKIMYIIVNKNFETILESIIDKINKDSEHFKRWYEQARPYIPTPSIYDEKHWVAAYIIYSNLGKFEKFLNKLHDIECRIKCTEDELRYLIKARSIIVCQIKDLRYKLDTLTDAGITNLQCEITAYQSVLNHMRNEYIKVLDKYRELKDEYKKVFREMKEFANQLVVS